MNEVVIFAPAPVLTITVEDHPGGGDIHLHAGGQGVWQARMLLALGAKVRMCATLSGETGRVLSHLLENEGITVIAVHREKLGSSYVHDRRGGERIVLAQTTGDPLSRHELDELYSLMLREGLDAGCAILSGPADETTLSADVYRRLAADLRTGGCRVIVDLAGARLNSALAGKPTVVKVSDEELLADGRITELDPEQIVTAIDRLHQEGAGTVIVTRAAEPLLYSEGGKLKQVRTPTMEIMDHTGAGDSLTAGVAATLSRGGTIGEAVKLGAAAGALNVTRHGLGTGELRTIEKLRELVTVHELDGTRISEPTPTGSITITLDELAARVEPEA